MLRAAMNVLVVGSGAREHALAWRISESPLVTRVFVAPGNAGTSHVATNLDVSATDLPALVDAARAHDVGLVVVGPEAPLVAGLVDALQAAGIATFGPSRDAARLEGSKIFSKDFMSRHGVPTADYAAFDDAAAAETWIRSRAHAPVVKADGLAAGKGVVVAHDHAEAIAAVRACLVERAFGDAGARVLLEDRLPGEEVSYHVVSDGTRYVALAAAQDHKRLGDGDTGPNTGGMGAYSPPPVVTPEIEARILREIVEPTLDGMRAEGSPFRGALFCGLMIDAGVPRVLEYNVRFGDPECEVLMARWDGDVVPLLLGSARGDLSGVSARFANGAAMAVVLAAHGYPVSVRKGDAITGLDRVPDGARVFHAGTKRSGERIVTDGGRVLTVCAGGATLADAQRLAYAGADAIAFDGKQLRRDIGWRALGRGH